MTALPKPQRNQDANYRAFVTGHACLIEKYHECDGPIDPHHVIPAGGGKTGSKVDDRRCVPLCRAGHELAGRRDWFESRYPVVFEEEIVRLNREYDRMPRKVRRVAVVASVIDRVLVRCECGQRHRLPASKISQYALTYHCPMKRSMVQATWRASA